MNNSKEIQSIMDDFYEIVPMYTDVDEQCSPENDCLRCQNTDCEFGVHHMASLNVEVVNRY